MKRYLYTCAVVFLLFETLISCKKESIESYFFKARIEGEWHTYSGAQAELGPDLADSTLNDFAIVVSDADFSNTLTIAMQSSAEISTGTYSTDAQNVPYHILIDFLKQSNGSSQDFDLTQPGNGSSPRYVLTITSITDSKITGTITGNFLFDSYYNQTMNFTQAEFAVERTR